LHLFSASPELVAFGRSAYRRRSEHTSSLLEQLFEKLRGEGFAMWTMEDFTRQYVKEHFSRLTPEECREALELLPPEKREEVLRSLPPEERLAGLAPEQCLAGLSAEQIEQVRQYLDGLAAGRAGAPRKPRRKK
jgi:hypothetical protein